MANVTKPPILDGTGQTIKQKLSEILAALQASGGSYIPLSQKGAASGVAELDANGKVPSAQLPSYVDDVVEYASRSAFPSTGESGKIYIALDTNLTYRWSGSEYVEISPSLALGETSSTAYRGDRGKTAYDHATESGKISAAVASGLYKIAATAQGHIAGLTAVEKADITALGIPGSMPTVNNSTITIKKNGTTVDSFTLNQSSAKDIDISVPTKTSDLTNDSGFITSYTDEKVTGETTNPSSNTEYYVTWVSGTANQKPKINNGIKVITREGTTSAGGLGLIRLGNATATGTAGNKYGVLRIYAEKSGYVNLKATAASTNERNIYLPDKAGTIALTTDTMTPASHTHGNIQNGGTLQTTDVAIASGDKLVICDSSDSNKIARSSLAFTSNTSKFLREDGTWQTVSVSWSGGTVSSNIVPSTAGGCAIGSSSLPFSSVYSNGMTTKTLFLKNDGTGSCKLILDSSVTSQANQFTLPNTGGTLATQEWVKAPTVVKSQKKNLTTNIDIVFKLWSNGMKSIQIDAPYCSGSAFTSAAGFVPDDYIPTCCETTNGVSYLRFTGYTTSSGVSRSMALTGVPNGKGTFYLYGASATGMYLTAFYV